MTETSSFAARVSLALLILIVACCGAGCGASGAGDDTSGSSDESNQMAADARHRATAEALFEHVRSLCTREYPDAASYYALVYAENPAQQLWMGFVADKEIPTYHYAQACMDRFGELPLMRQTMVWEIEGFTWLSVDADRALLEVANRHGVKRPLHLVRVGDQWWISGYTFERGNIGFEEPAFERFARSMSGLAPYVGAVTDRIRRGDFATLAEAEAAHSAAISAWGRTRSPAP